MTNLVLAGLLLGSLGTAGAAAAGTGGDHRVRVDHHGGAVDAVYRSDVAVTHRQVGAVAPGGRASTLRCRWSAGLTIEREARHPGGATLSRQIARDAVIAGSRPGWCKTQREAIAREVAGRRDELRRHMLAAAEEDRATLAAEIDRAHSARTG